MWRSGTWITGFLLLVCSLASAQKVLILRNVRVATNGSVIDQMINNGLPDADKKFILTQYKTLLSIAYNLIFVPYVYNTTAHGIFYNHKGGFSGGNLGDETLLKLREAYKNSSNKELFREFIKDVGMDSEDPSRGFMRGDIYNSKRDMDYVHYPFIAGAIKKFGIGMAGLKQRLISGSWKIAEEAMEKLGLVNVPRFYPEVISNLTQFLANSSFLRDGTLFDSLELMEKDPSDLQKLKVIINAFKNGQILQVFEELDSDSNLDQDFQTQLEKEKKAFDFDVTYFMDIVKDYERMPSQYKKILLEQLNGIGEKFFEKLDESSQNLVTYFQKLAPLSVSFNGKQLEVIESFLSSWKSFDDYTRDYMKKMMTGNDSSEECQMVWKNQKEHEQLKNVVKLAQLLNKEFGIWSCVGNSISLSDIDTLVAFWKLNNNAVIFLGHGFNRAEEASHVIPQILKNFHPSQRKRLSTELLDALEEYCKLKNPDSWLLLELDTLRNVSIPVLETFSSILKQFAEMSSDQRAPFFNQILNKTGGDAYIVNTLKRHQNPNSTFTVEKIAQVKEFMVAHYEEIHSYTDAQLKSLTEFVNEWDSLKVIGRRFARVVILEDVENAECDKMIEVLDDDKQKIRFRTLIEDLNELNRNVCMKKPKV